jgi:archaellum component FlaC
LIDLYESRIRDLENQVASLQSNLHQQKKQSPLVHIHQEMAAISQTAKDLVELLSPTVSKHNQYRGTHLGQSYLSRGLALVPELTPNIAESLIPCIIASLKLTYERQLRQESRRMLQGEESLHGHLN